MTYRIIASNGRESRPVEFTTAIGGVVKTTFGYRESVDAHAAVLAAGNPGWDFKVIDESITAMETGRADESCE